MCVLVCSLVSSPSGLERWLSKTRRQELHRKGADILYDPASVHFALGRAGVHVNWSASVARVALSASLPQVVRLPPGATNISTSRPCEIHGMMMMMVMTAGPETKGPAEEEEEKASPSSSSSFSPAAIGGTETKTRPAPGSPTPNLLTFQVGVAYDNEKYIRRENVHKIDRQWTETVHLWAGRQVDEATLAIEMLMRTSIR